MSMLPRAAETPKPWSEAFWPGYAARPRYSATASGAKADIAGLRSYLPPDLAVTFDGVLLRMYQFVDVLTVKTTEQSLFVIDYAPTGVHSRARLCPSASCSEVISLSISSRLLIAVLRRGSDGLKCAAARLNHMYALT